MQTSASASDSVASAAASGHAVKSILGYVYFSFICYLSIGLPLAVLPAFVHLQLGFHAALAGLVISIQYIATFLSRPWVDVDKWVIKIEEPNHGEPGIQSRQKHKDPTNTFSIGVGLLRDPASCATDGTHTRPLGHSGCGRAVPPE